MKRLDLGYFVILMFEAVGAGILGVILTMILTNPLNAVLRPMGLDESGTVAMVISLFVGAAMGVPLVGRALKERGVWWMALVGAGIGTLIIFAMLGVAYVLSSSIVSFLVLPMFALPALLSAAAYSLSVPSKKP